MTCQGCHMLACHKCDTMENGCSLTGKLLIKYIWQKPKAFSHINLVFCFFGIY